jgi:hypothetical protein
MNQYDTITAKFNPKKTSDLRPDAEQFIGQTFNWLATHVIESGPYKKQWSFMATDDKFPRPVFSVPECDLEIVGCCSNMDWSGEDMTKPHHSQCPLVHAAAPTARLQLTRSEAHDAMQQLIEHYSQYQDSIQPIGEPIIGDHSKYLLITRSRTGLRLVIGGYYTPVLPANATPEEIQAAYDELRKRSLVEQTKNLQAKCSCIGDCRCPMPEPLPEIKFG